MNQQKFFLSSYNILYLFYLQCLLKHLLSFNKDRRFLLIGLYLKWQYSDCLNTGVINVVKHRKFTVLRSPFVDKTAREQLALIFFKTNICLLSVFNNKYYYYKNSLSVLDQVAGKQFYLQIKQSNCYLVQN